MSLVKILQVLTLVVKWGSLDGEPRGDEEKREEKAKGAVIGKGRAVKIGHHRQPSDSVSNP